MFRKKPKPSSERLSALMGQLTAQCQKPLLLNDQSTISGWVEQLTSVNHGMTGVTLAGNSPLRKDIVDLLSQLELGIKNQQESNEPCTMRLFLRQCQFDGLQRAIIRVRENLGASETLNPMV